MKKIFLLTCLSISLYSQELDILNEDKKKLRQLETQIIKEEFESQRNEWISPVNLNSNIRRNHTFDEDSDSLSKSVSIGFTQSVFESGGIGFTIDYAEEKYRSDFLAWENQNNEILQSVYNTLLEIKKLYVQLEQINYELKNSEIELVLKKIQYENGKADITELNDAIMSKNTQYRQSINLGNQIKEQKLNLAKYTNLKFEEIALINFDNIKKEEFLKTNLDLEYQSSLLRLADISNKRTKTNYLPKLSVSTNVDYSENENLRTNDESDSTSGSISLNLSMPLYDINKKSELEKSRLEVLKEKLSLNDLKNEISKSFDEALTRIDTYENYNLIIKDNIALYEDLISVNEASNSVGMSATYDLEILKNTKKINEYDLEINNINIQQEYTKLYFETKVNN